MNLPETINVLLICILLVFEVFRAVPFKLSGIKQIDYMNDMAVRVDESFQS